MIIFIIGVNHELQWNEKKARESGFWEYLKCQTKELNIELIGEEFSREALRKNGVRKTVPQKIAELLEVKHKFCDPDSKERVRLGIPTVEEIKKKLNIKGMVKGDPREQKRIEEEKRKYYKIREKFWLDRIKEEDCQTILFICGSDHLKSFPSLLTKEGYKYKVIKDFKF